MKVTIPEELKEVLVGDEEELLSEDEDDLRVPRSGKRKIMPIERLWDKRDS
jgi:hypothetical protein